MGAKRRTKLRAIAVSTKTEDGPHDRLRDRVLLEVDPAPDNGWQEQSKQRAPITKDEDENSSWSCDAHGVDTYFPVEIDEEKEEGPDKITKHHNGRKQRRMSGK